MLLKFNQAMHQDELMEDITPVSTPTEQVTFWPEPPRYGRTASVSSIASSVSNMSTQDFSYQQFASHYRLTDVFEKLLYEIYQSYHTNPQITPFQVNNPPSGVLNRVSKDALHTAQENGMEIGIEVNNYTLSIIRQKLIQLCRVSSQGSTGLVRNNSVSSVGGNFPMLNLNNKFNQVAPSSPWELRTPTESQGYFSFETPPPFAPYAPQQQTPSTPPTQQLQPSFLHEQIQQQQLHDHIQEQMKQEIVIPELFNATSNRKRESLRLKRSGSAVTYN